MNITKYVFGDIVLGNYMFTDHSSTKKRPMLILAREEDDYVVVFISSQQEIRSDGDILIVQDAINNLAKDSVIRTRKITTIHEDIIYKKLGELSPEDQIIVKENISTFFSNL